jgi:glyoxylase-like metal-dependent hydrolase (beta-lactamase superfamily II)
MTMNEKYFRNHCVTERIVHIEDPMGVFVTLIIGEEKALLFDTAFGLGNLKEHISELVDKPLIIINSHGHVDHLSGNYHFDQAILFPEGDQSLLELHTSPSMRQRTIHQAQSKQLLPAGFDEEAYLSAELSGKLIPIHEGQLFDLGGVRIEVISTPSHTRGSVSLLCREERVLLLGDAANPFLFLFLPESTSVKEYLRTLYKVKEIPFDHYLISHNPQLWAKSVIDLYIQCAENIDVAKSIPFIFPPRPELEALLYTQGEIDTDNPDYKALLANPDFAAIIYTVDRL